MTKPTAATETTESRPAWTWLVPLVVVLVVVGYFMVRHRHDRTDVPVAALPVVVPPLPFLGSVRFERDRATLTPDGERTLDLAADALRSDPAIRMRVEGMASDTHATERNASLEMRRALAVEAYLGTRGVGRGQLTGSGFGPANPQDTEAARVERQDGPRVELFSQQ